MGIDPNIILGVRPVQIRQNDQGAAIGRAFAIKNAMTQDELQGRALADDDAVRAAYSANPTDASARRAALLAGGQYKAVQAQDDADLGRREKESNIGKNDAAANKSKHDQLIGDLERVGSVLQGANPANYGALRRQLIVQYPNLTQTLPEQFDANEIGGVIAQGQTLTQKLAAKQAADTAAESKRHNKATEAGTIRGQNMTDSRAREGQLGGKVPSGYRALPDGTLTFISGGPADPNTAAGKAAMGQPSEDERKAAGWLAQATNAYNNMASAMTESRGAESPTIGEAVAGSLPWGMGESAANALRSPARQKFVQSASSFAEAALRAATGAGVNKEEAAQKIRELTPVWTDSDPVKQQKLDSMGVYLDSLSSRANRGKNGLSLPERSTMPDVKRKSAIDPGKLSNEELLRELQG